MNWMFPLYNSQKLLLALEYGVTISEVAKERGVELTPAHIHRAEGIILKEFREKTAERVAIDMIPNIMAVFEPN